MTKPTPLELYTTVATDCARSVVARYSTSFGLACRFLGTAARRDVECIYALVRIADEIVDGVADEAGLSPQQGAVALRRLEAETDSAMRTGYSVNLIVHAFAATAQRNGITTELTRPFFAAMRSDINPRPHDARSLAEYIYGSAEVVGLMCLCVFCRMPGTDSNHGPELVTAARRLGSAFQKVNFLRDTAFDQGELGRHYFPGIDPRALTEVEKADLIDDIYADLQAARAGMPYLDVRARMAVEVAYRLFTALADLLDQTPAERIMERRIRISNVRKAAIAAQVVSHHAFMAVRR